MLYLISLLSTLSTTIENEEDHHPFFDAILGLIDPDG